MITINNYEARIKLMVGDTTDFKKSISDLGQKTQIKIDVATGDAVKEILTIKKSLYETETITSTLNKKTNEWSMSATTVVDGIKKTNDELKKANLLEQEKNKYIMQNQQAYYNTLLGIDKQVKSAKDSASVFQENFKLAENREKAELKIADAQQKVTNNIEVMRTRLEGIKMTSEQRAKVEERIAQIMQMQDPKEQQQAMKV